MREAFQILERDGLISLQQNRGATVLGINEKKRFGSIIRSGPSWKKQPVSFAVKMEQIFPL